MFTINIQRVPSASDSPPARVLIVCDRSLDCDSFVRTVERSLSAKLRVNRLA